MPLYDVRCSRSGKVFERQIPLAEFGEPIFCACQSPASRVISKPRIIVDNVGYQCPVTDKWIGSKREHRENLRRQGCRVLETGEKEANEAARLKMEAEFDRGIEETVEKTIDSWDSDKREKLANELERGGVDLEFKRGTI